MSKEALPLSDDYMVRGDFEARFGGHEEFNDHGDYSKGVLEGMGGQLNYLTDTPSSPGQVTGSDRGTTLPMR